MQCHRLVGLFALLLWAGLLQAETATVTTPPAPTAVDAGAQQALLGSRLERALQRKAALQQQQLQQQQTLQALREQLQQLPAEAELEAVIQQQVTTLTDFIQHDLPYLRAERLQRLQGLAGSKGGKDPQERYRQLLQVYNDELELGRTIDAYDGELESDQGKRWVTFLRYGRVVLFYQTFDQSETAWWDVRAGSWQRLNGPFTREVQRGIRIAHKQSPPICC